jgi:predicted NBD/HSP70 family sugar kinase
MRPTSPALLRDFNRTAVLRLIGRDGPIARAEIARRLGVSPATVTAVTRGLIGDGLVQVVDRAPSQGGRPSLLLDLIPSAAQALGVKIAPDHIAGVRVNLDADLLERFEQPFTVAAGDSIERLADVIRPRLEGGPGSPVLLGIGLGVPGIVDNAGRGGLVTSPMLGWRDFPLGELLARELGVPVLVDNDVNTLAIAERLYGRGHDSSHFLTVTIGLGVGLGIVIDGAVYRGAFGAAGEFGHVPVADEGPECECGKRGCLEALVADPALVAEARAAGLLAGDEGIGRLRELADTGDESARSIYSRAGETLGRSVAALVNVLNPELVLVSGEGVAAWPHLGPSFERELRRSAFPPLADVAIEVDPWDDARWARGAAALVLGAALLSPGADSSWLQAPDEAVA